jgi:hypothetical protein
MSDFVFYGYVDSAFADIESTSESTGGWFFFLGRTQGAVNSKSGTTGAIALSSTEAETIWPRNVPRQATSSSS